MTNGNGNWNGSRRWTVLGGTCACVSVVGLVFGWGWAASSDKAEVRAAVQEHSKSLGDHEERLRDVEQRMERIDTNVQWIVERMRE